MVIELTPIYILPTTYYLLLTTYRMVIELIPISLRRGTTAAPSPMPPPPPPPPPPPMGPPPLTGAKDGALVLKPRSDLGGDRVLGGLSGRVEA